VKVSRLIIGIILIISLVACSNKAILPELTDTQTSLPANRQDQTESILTITGNNPEETPTNREYLEEVEVIPLKLPDRISAASFEYSGMGWFGDYMVLLPQYPEGKDFSRKPNLFAIAKQDLLAAVTDPDLELPVRDIPIENSDLRSVIKGFEGFESILFVDQNVYMTIESRAGDPMMGYLIRGVVNGDLESITLDVNSLVELRPFSSELNATFEGMTYWNGSLYVMYEHNSMRNVKQPVAYQINPDLENIREIPFPVINYRITDATISDVDGKFWVMNYFFPGDTHLAVDQDSLVEEYGEGKTYAENDPVERLVQLQIENDQISRIDQPPTYLQLLDNDIARNWEGLVMLDNLGFLLITDSFPGSVLGFCPILR